MTLDPNQLLEELKGLAKPELQKRVNDLRTMFLSEIDEFVDSSRVHKLDDLLRRAGEYEIQAVLSTDQTVAKQYATAATDVLRQIRLLVYAEQIVATREMAAMIEAAAYSLWEGFKTVAAATLNLLLKVALSGALGPAGGSLADIASGFLGEALGSLTEELNSAGADEPS